jgi:transcriptional regulator with XRE-family HTH domain
VSIGDELAEARRQAGLTIAQVSQRTCIRETIVRGIERGDYSACGGDFYARGHIRSIARAVGLEPEQLIREYDATQSPPRPISAADVFQPFTPVKLKERRRPNWTVLLLAGLVAALAVVGYHYFSAAKHTNPPAASNLDPHSHSGAHARSTATTHSTTSHHTAAPATHNRRVLITMAAGSKGYSWVELTSDSGQLIYEGDVMPGHPMSFNEAHPVLVTIGNPPAVTFTENGKTYSHLGIYVAHLNCTKDGCTG